MSEKMPIETYRQPSWQDASLKDIHEQIARNNLKQAKFLTELRLRALQGIVSDIEETIDRNEEGEVTDETWAAEKASIEEEIAELEPLLQTLQNQQELE